MPEPYIIVLTSLGVLIALASWLPLVLRRLPLSVPIMFLVLGATFFALPFTPRMPLPSDFPEVTERVTELIVIIALMGAGLKLDRPLSLRDWHPTWLLLGITMPLSILAIALLGAGTMSLSIPAAILLGAALAPTDPVLASDVQVGPPRSGDEDDVRFGLTSEAGLNDGLAFPFVNLAVVLAVASVSGETWLFHWAAVDVFWKIGIGIVAGWLIGRAFGWMTFQLPPGSPLAKTGDGFIALSATLVAYGATEVVHGYGFLAVFVSALTFRRCRYDDEFHHQMHAFIEQVERMLTMVVLMFLGGALVNGMLAPLQLIDVVIAAVIILIVRPVTGLLGLWPSSQLTLGEKAMLAFFGIRGLGSFYYIAYGLNHSPIEDAGRLWAIVGLIVVLSVLLHGVSVTPLMNRFDMARGKKDFDPKTQSGTHL